MNCRTSDEPKEEGDARDARAESRDDAAEALCAGALCQPGMTEVEGKFCVDKYEASLIEVRGNGSDVWSPYHAPAATATYRAASVAGRVPQAYISGAQAAAACRNASKRLCEAAEWVKACEGPAKLAYPYGKDYKLQACNEHSRDPKWQGPLQRLFNGNPKYDMASMNDPRINQTPGALAPSGSYAGCESGYGVFDLVGNIHEWTAERNKANGVFRGGYFNEAELNGPGCSYKTARHEFAYHDYSTGFRCCAEVIPPPTFK